MSSPIDGDLNQVIVSAVNARVEAAVAAAMSGDEVMGKYVAAALNQQIEVGNSYNRKQTTFLRHTIDNAMRDAAKVAVAEAIAEQKSVIVAAVKDSIVERLGLLANNMVDALADTATNPYAISVDVKYRDPNRNDD